MVEMIDRLGALMEEASECESVVTISEVCSCLTHLMGSIPGSDLFPFLLDCCGEDEDKVESLVASLYGSILATLLANFSKPRPKA